MSSRRKTRIAPNPFAAWKPTPAITLALGVALVIATIVAHFPAVYAGYIWDDALFLFNSPLVAAPDGIYKAWFTSEGSDYWPLMSTMFWCEWRIYGTNPMPYHITNIILHAGGVAVLWLLLLRLGIGGPGAWIGSLIFAIHPVTVESVAWIAERKNVLSLPIFVCALLAFMRYEDRRNCRWYTIALMAGALALLAKASTVMLPVVLLLCAWWRRGRITRTDVIRTLPFFGMSLALGLVEMWFVRQQVLQGEIGRPEGIASRIAASGWIAWFYLYKIIAPINLALVYPRWDVDAGRILSHIPLTLLLSLLIVLWVYRKNWGRGPLAAMVYFVVTLLPVAGLLNMQFNRYSLVADHLQYLAMPAILALIGSGMGLAWQRTLHNGTPALVACASGVIAVIVLMLGGLTWHQAYIYRSEIPLWTHTIELNPRAWVAYNNRGAALSEHGQQDLAIKDFDKAIELMPKYPEAYCNRGNAHQKAGNYIQAIRDCDRCIQIKADYANAYNTRGIAYSRSGQHEAAIADYDKAIALQPQNPDTYNNRAVTYFYLKQYDKSWADLQKYRRLGGKPHPAFVKSLNDAVRRAP